jgi:hypothetical protein
MYEKYHHQGVMSCSLVQVHRRWIGRSSWIMSIPGKQTLRNEQHTCSCLFDMLVDPGDGVNTFRRIAAELLPEYTVSHFRRQYSVCFQLVSSCLADILPTVSIMF